MKGGYRPGAGRKRGFAARSSEEARKLFSELLMREIEPIAEALIAKAKNGDVTAAKELFDRSWGKPIAQADIPKPLEVDDWGVKEPGWLLEEYAKEITLRASN